MVVLLFNKISNVKGKESLSKKELKEFKNFVEKFQDDIVQKWIDYFVYHKSVQCIKIEEKIKYGDIEWNDYELVFPIFDLYQEKI